MTVAVGIEFGGTKTVVAGSVSGPDLIGRRRIPTTEPDTTLAAVAEAVEELSASGALTSIGIGTFGPVDLRAGAATYGTIMQTPKPGWSGVHLLERLARRWDVITAIDTDVAGALLGEIAYGAADATTAAYVTVGTGVGAAVSLGKGVLHGANHPEIGHVRVPRRVDDDFPGRCPYHADCLEGMASGPALAARFGGRLEDLDPSDRAAAVDLAAEYVGHGVFTLIAVIPVEVVIIGGGVAKLPGFHDGVARSAAAAAGGYPPIPFASRGPRIVAPRLGDDAGVIGAIELGRRAAERPGAHG